SAASDPSASSEELDSPRKSRRKRAAVAEVTVEEVLADRENLAIADVEEPEPPPRRRAAPKPAAGITIVDTSAALEKDVSAKETKKEKRAAKEQLSFKLPPLDMLVPAPASIGPTFDEVKLRANAELLVKTLSDYKITGKVEEILPG